MGVRQLMRHYWRVIILIFVPLILSPLIFPLSDRSNESKCGFMVLLMAIFWISEVLPLPVTSLLPIALSPLLGVESGKNTCKVFFSDLTFLGIGTLFMAAAIEKSLLHKRIALAVLSKIGVQPRRLMLGLMLITACLSMWVSNTVATAMMLPITKAVLTGLYGSEERKGGSESDKHDNSKEIEMDTHRHENTEETECTESEVHTRLVATAPPSYEESVQYEQSTAQERFINKRQVKIDACSSHGEDIQLADFTTDEKQKNEIKRSETTEKKATAGPSYEYTLRIFNLSTAYASNAGGLATLTGTPPNMVLSQTVETMTGHSGINFAKWMLFGFPLTILMLSLSYVWLNFVLYGVRATLAHKPLSTKDQENIAMQTIEKEIRALGKMKYNEKVVIAHFVILILLWLTRHPGFARGWDVLFQESYITDGAAAMAVAFSLFVFSDERPSVFCCRRGEGEIDNEPAKSTPSLLTWKYASRELSWGLLFLFGGGFVMANLIKVSGLSDIIRDGLLIVSGMPGWLACTIIICFVCVITEITSNTVITILILPILNDMAIVLAIHPMYLMLPATLATSMAFMLPVATPPNALVYASGGVKISDMIKCGSVLNILGVMVILLATHTWGWYVFDLGSNPRWNSTVVEFARNITQNHVMHNVTNGVTSSF